MSLNGDTMIIRNGRATSQVSIYNYPEHLNPFFEDDQHKRIRFWHVGKHKDNGSRRSSFSLDGLKDMWAFKSFRSKKKSSTLGINKTSESPPPLRRDYYLNTPSTTNGVNTIGSRYSSPADNFQRNATYRSSLQNMNNCQDSPGGLGLHRNDQYRSTIQFAGRTPNPNQNNHLQQHKPRPHPRRYVYGGSVTPQPQRSTDFNKGDSSGALKPGLSRTSLSTNPFDSDGDEEDFENLSRNDSQMSLTKRTHRKKRPAPPVPTTKTETANISNNKAINNDFTIETSHLNTELRIEETNEIANLTAEIESFVKTTTSATDLDDNSNQIQIDKTVHVDQHQHQRQRQQEHEQQHEKEAPPQEQQQSPKINNHDNLQEETIKAEPTVLKVLKYSPLTVMRKEFKTTTTAAIADDIPQNEPNGRLQWRPSKKMQPKNSNQSEQNQLQPVSQTGHIECIHVHVESPRTTPERTEPSRVTSFQQKQHATRIEEANLKTGEGGKPVVSGEKFTGKTSFTLINPPNRAREDSKIDNSRLETTPSRQGMPNRSGGHHHTTSLGENKQRIDVGAPSQHEVKTEIHVKQNKPEVQERITITTETILTSKQLEALQERKQKVEKDPAILVNDNTATTSDTIQETPRSPVKPPIAAKPILDSKDKSNNQFAAIHKPHKRTVAFNDDTSSITTTNTTTTTTKTTVNTNETQSPASNSSSIQSKGATPKLMVNQSNKIMNGTVYKDSEQTVISDLIDSPLRSHESKLCADFILHEKKATENSLTRDSKPSDKLSSQIKPISKDQLEVVLPKTAPIESESLKIVETGNASSCQETAATTVPSSVSASTTLPTVDHSSASLSRTADTYFQEHEPDFIALYRTKPSSHAEWKQSTLAPLNAHNGSTDRRRSVKDIIESINRSQRLLHASANKNVTNQTNAASQPPSYSEIMNCDIMSAGSSKENTPIAPRRHREVNNNNLSRSNPVDVGASQSNGNENEIEEAATTSAVTIDPQKLSNKEIFEKGRVNKEVYDYRETSPTASNLDWNPVPKPKRSKNMPDLN